MKQTFVRLIALSLVAVLAIAAAVLPDQQVLLTLDQTRIPAQVIIRTADDTIDTLTFKTTLIDAIDEAGLSLNETDLLSLADQTRLQPGQTFDVQVCR